jgi:CO dehydrogenase/acetyl-CoA synthase gamma subunit (corrinoid Fe-S protein)
MVDFEITHPAGEPKWTRLSNGITVLTEGIIVVADDAQTHADIHLSVEYNKIVDRYIVTKVSVETTNRLHEVAGSTLREIRVQEIVQEAAMYMVWSSWDPDTMQLAKDVMAEFKPLTGRTNSLDLERVAFVYRATRIMNMPPLKEVARVFQVSHSTATRLAARIREEKRIAF